MNKERILSFKMSQKISNSELSGVVAAQAEGSIQVTYDPQTHTSHISFDPR